MSKEMSIKHISDIGEAKDLWEKLIIPKTIYDDWEFRYLFYKPLAYPIDFIVGFDTNNNPIGLLPMQFNTQKGYYEFFGGDFMEYNKLYIKESHENYIPEFIKSIDKKYKLRSMASNRGFGEKVKLEDYSYFLSLSKIKNIDDYFQIYLPREARNQFKRKIKKVERNNIKFRYDHKEDLEYLIKYNIQLFPEDSHFYDSAVKNAFYGMLNSKFDVRLLTILVNDNVESVGLSILYNNIYYYVLSGTNRESIDNLGMYLVIKILQSAIELKADIFDAGRNDCNWKERWHLEKNPQYLLSTV